MILGNNTLLQDRYLLLGLLGQGGFGAVYEARDQRLGHRVALKQLMLSGQPVQKAFEREARILARLKHAALPKVSDYFVDANGYFLVMEFIQGDDLEQMLAKRHEPFPVEQVLGWAFQVLEALEYLHGQQPPVIHRDIKPANIKISPMGKLYLLDFGISKGGRTHTHQAISGASMQAFSEHYASIEQIEGKGTDARSDLYSLAVTLHHLLTMHTPPRTVSRASAKAMNRADPLRPINELNIFVPQGVAQVLTSTLNFDPALRPDSARTMRVLLQEAIRPPQPPPIPPQPPRRTSKRATQPAPQTQLPSWAIAVGGVIVLILGILLGSMLISNPDPTPETAVLPTEVRIATEEPAIEPTIPPTETSLPPIETPIPPTETPVPELGIGSTRVVEDDMVQVYVPAGDFLMGSEDDDADSDEAPEHTVNLDAYWIDQTEVTNEMFGRFVAETGYQTEAEKEGTGRVCADGSCDWVDGAEWQHPQGPESDLSGLENHPVVQVSWDDATAYCEWAGRRLPTEAEWEKAARGTDGQKYPWGDEAPTGELVNFCDANCPFDWKDESVNDGYALTAPVGNYPAGASPYGALDMAGNVWEWVSDWYDENYYADSPRNSPLGPSVEGEYRVVRGGSWSNEAWYLRAPRRARDVASARNDSQGFRCAASDS